MLMYGPAAVCLQELQVTNRKKSKLYVTQQAAMYVMPDQAD